ncbi:hypothetical protein TBLA_0F03840 [Henningerozyma blattae CBS 6284]|uniref:DNA mismatch repair protein n=1 Tax=Henningerozyma blattae (strain ATCC 34711 / CBS 6284 / DSM 70876 / NBRC 10599 / NRRL Y-10934 / UCD 77-7) TaxID=1071380 RepID=I2H6B6_HENB6|nr:hypothetical protein TBLA_0F03840 [Tetrapisispora blattae CBS 6284]CCH61918.1 hypothetical protein TBLA_0F03840 [Tetrapisispora blattae CBS 6284]
MAPSTPLASKTKKFGTPTSSQKKMKQSSLLSFFSKSSTKSSKPTNNSIKKKDPSKSPTPKKSSPSLFVSNGDDKEDDSDSLKSDDLILPDPTKSKSHANTSLTSNSIQTSSSQPIATPDTEVSTMNNTSTLIGDSKISAKNEKSDDELENKPLVDDDDALATSGRRSKRAISYAEDSDDDEDNIPLKDKSKRPKRAAISDDDDDDYIPTKKETEQKDDDDEEEDINMLLDDDDDDDLIQLGSAKSKKDTKLTSKLHEILAKPSSTKSNKPKTFKPKKPNVPAPKHSKFVKENEQRYQWLVNIKDAQGHEESDPDYDPRTLYIPSSAWGKFTPFEKQYWEIKSKMWDCIVFFKKGKFFELYEKDAILANNLFDWKIAGGGRANMQLAGIPEMSFDHWSSQFIQLGYKVAKVDQRESMLAKEMREGTKGIVKRELEYVLTSGTLTDGDMLQSDLATYCLAVREEPGNYYGDDDTFKTPGLSLSKKIFGVAFIDTATGLLEMLEFEDDSECSQLETLMSQIKPKEVLIEKNNLSNLANKIVKFNASPNAIFNYLKPEEEFFGFDKTYDELVSNDPPYFATNDDWPKVLKEYYDSKKKVGFSAFGGLLYYLRWLKLDKSLISMGNINEYNPIKSQNSLILDGVTLQNLEIFANSFDGSDKGTLFKLLNQGVTPMGKRMLRKWVIHPLFNKSAIEQRQDSIELLLSDMELRELFESKLSVLPDLERMLARIHSGNLKMKLFEKVIQGFEVIVELIEQLKSFELKGALKTFLSQVPESLFNDVKNWSNAFDRRKALEEDIIELHLGVEPEFDQSRECILSIENELNDILSGYKRRFKTSNIKYKDSGKELYTIEVPISIVKSIPSDWVQMGSTKTSKRYYSEEVRSLARSMAEARENHKIIENGLKEKLCKRFDLSYQTSWMPTINMISNIDCLLALTRTSESIGFPACKPKFIDNIDEKTGGNLNGYLKFKSLRHPCFNLGSSTYRDFIPNDVELGKDVPQLGLLTGANAAGKSTVLRMTCIAVIMAQLGCWVPCEEAELTSIDRIMTRLGANDNIMQGKSTFFVELSETKKILDTATNRSLLVVDELGRGGSSSDGFAIAESVLHHVATHIQSLGFFATHYGNLGLSFKSHPQIRELKMQILVDDKTRNVTFLYKLINGQSEGSFGMHVASMCGIPKEIVDRAQDAADNLEHTSKLFKEMQIQKGAADCELNKPVPIGLQSDFVRLVFGDGLKNNDKGTGEGVQIYNQTIRKGVCVVYLV